MGRLTASMMMMLLGRVVEGQGGARVFTGAGRAFDRCRTGRCRVVHACCHQTVQGVAPP